MSFKVYKGKSGFKSPFKSTDSITEQDFVITSAGAVANTVAPVCRFLNSHSYYVPQRFQMMRTILKN